MSKPAHKASNSPRRDSQGKPATRAEVESLREEIIQLIQKDISKAVTILTDWVKTPASGDGHASPGADSDNIRTLPANQPLIKKKAG